MHVYLRDEEIHLKRWQDWPRAIWVSEKLPNALFIEIFNKYYFIWFYDVQAD